MLFEGTFCDLHTYGYLNRDVPPLKPLVNVVELEDAMSEVEGVHPEITGDRPCDGLRVDLKRCLLKVSQMKCVCRLTKSD